MNGTKKRRHRLPALKSILAPFAALLILAGIILWSTGILKERVPPDTLPRERGFALPPAAEIHIAEKKPVGRLVDIPGTVTSETTVHINPRINAHVTGVHADAGDRVARGDLLVSLDDRDMRERLHAAEADFEQARTEFERTKRLFETDAATDKAYVAARSEYQRARARKNETLVSLDYTEIRAPVDGVVTERHIETGDLSTPERTILSIFQPEAMRLEAPVPVRLAGQISVGDRFPVHFDAPGGRYTGQVSEIIHEIDPKSRTRTVRVRLPEKINSVLPGTFGRLRLESPAEDGIFVPQSAVYRVGQLEMVQYVSDGRVTVQLVKTGPRRDGFVEILAGLDPGDTVLVHPRPMKSAGHKPSGAAFPGEQ